MDDALLVRRFERLGDLPGDRQRFVEGNRPARDRCDRSSPSTSSITRAVTPPLSSRPWMCGDVRMVQRREHFRFALKPREPIGIGRERRRQNLDRDLAFELRVRRAIDLPHAARADRGGDFIDAETGAGSEGQGWRDYTGRTDSGRNQSR